MLNNTAFALPSLTRWKKNKFLQHAERVLSAQQQMQSQDGKTILHYTLNGQLVHEAMSHYPPGDRIDHSSGAQYFYHCDRENRITEEHGHFHCFFRYKHIPKHIKPSDLPDWNKNFDNPMTHLVAIAMNRFGQPVRLFSVNRWVTAETWYDAHHTPSLIKRYKMNNQDSAYWQILDQWVEGMLHLFSPQIEWLNHQRDATIKEHRDRDPKVNYFEERTLEELSEIKIDLAQQIQWVINNKCVK